MRGMRAYLRLAWLVIGLGLLIGIAVWSIRRNGAPERTSKIGALESASENARPDSHPRFRGVGESADRAPATAAELSKKIAATASFLAGKNETAIQQERLAALRAVLLGADSAAAAGAIRDYLASGNDAATGQPFRVGADGALDAAPSLRVFLLDILGSVDPTAALEWARRVMEHPANADEYAIALRNLAWNDADGDLTPEVKERFSQMIARDEWRAEPSDGFLEALDAAVLLGGSDVFARLLELNRDALASGTEELSRACFIAMDRMVEMDPAALEIFRASPETRDHISADQRASLLSRLDIGRAAHKEILTAYLTSASDPEELAYFASIYPNGNQFRVNRLFSAPNPVVPISQRIEADRAVLRELSTLSFPQESLAQAAVETIRKRLDAALKDAAPAK